MRISKMFWMNAKIILPAKILLWNQPYMITSEGKQYTMNSLVTTKGLFVKVNFWLWAH